jgi:hypothetical protein
MILVWNDSKSFSRHLENMRRFRERHGANAKCGWDIIKDMPAMRDIRVPADTGGTRSRLEAVGPMVVPLWKFTLPAGVIN